MVSEHENEQQQPYGRPSSEPVGSSGPDPQSPPAYGTAPYPQPTYGSAPYPGDAGMYPEPSQAVLGFVLGLVGLVAFQLLGPFAWVVSNREIQGIDQGRRNPANRGLAVAGKVLGIITTVLLALGVLILIVALLGLAAFSRGD
jgi:hypothetical protein